MRAEIREIVGDDETITAQHIKQLDYLERCIKESLRLLPIGPHIGRNITKEIVLSMSIFKSSLFKKKFGYENFFFLYVFNTCRQL